jgi:hypothetical protein
VVIIGEDDLDKVLRFVLPAPAWFLRILSNGRVVAGLCLIKLVLAVVLYARIRSEPLGGICLIDVIVGLYLPLSGPAYLTARALRTVLAELVDAAGDMKDKQRRLADGTWASRAQHEYYETSLRQWRTILFGPGAAGRFKQRWFNLYGPACVLGVMAYIAITAIIRTLQYFLSGGAQANANFNWAVIDPFAPTPCRLMLYSAPGLLILLQFLFEAGGTFLGCHVTLLLLRRVLTLHEQATIPEWEYRRVAAHEEGDDTPGTTGMQPDTGGAGDSGLSSARSPPGSARKTGPRRILLSAPSSAIGSDIGGSATAPLLASSDEGSGSAAGGEAPPVEEWEGSQDSDVEDGSSLLSCCRRRATSVQDSSSARASTDARMRYRCVVDKVVVKERTRRELVVTNLPVQSPLEAQEEVLCVLKPLTERVSSAVSPFLVYFLTFCIVVVALNFLAAVQTLQGLLVATIIIFVVLALLCLYMIVFHTNGWIAWVQRRLSLVPAQALRQAMEHWAGSILILSSEAASGVADGGRESQAATAAGVGGLAPQPHAALVQTAGALAAGHFHVSHSAFSLAPASLTGSGEGSGTAGDATPHPASGMASVLPVHIHGALPQSADATPGVAHEAPGLPTDPYHLSPAQYLLALMSPNAHLGTHASATAAMIARIPAGQGAAGGGAVPGASFGGPLPTAPINALDEATRRALVFYIARGLPTSAAAYRDALKALYADSGSLTQVALFGAVVSPTLLYQGVATAAVTSALPFVKAAIGSQNFSFNLMS